jgi:hypothetical protein
MNLPSLPTVSGASLHLSALAGVVVGAVLATLSGILGNQYEALARRREQERTAALLLGEVFATVRLLLEGAEGSVKVGEPFGPFTRRLLASVRREMNIYERNRESLVALNDAQLRSDIHNAALRIVMPLDSLLDSFLITDGGLAEADQRRIFGFLMEMAQRLPGLIARLGRIARHNFDDYGEAVQQRVIAEAPPA